MKYHCILLILTIIYSNVTGQRDYPIQPVPFTQVKVNDKFWAPKIKTNAEVSIPYTFGKCFSTGRVDNFHRAAGKLKDDKSTSFTFDDTDLYKTIEGASYSLQTNPNKALESYLDTIIAHIGAAQESDGYLYTFRTMNNTKPHEWQGSKRWEKEEDLSHELYNSGHLYEAAVAHYRATGKRNLLDIAIKNADLLVKTFGWGKEEKFPGHQIIETGLVKLYRITNKADYLDLAKFFLDLRGHEGHFNQEYSQSHKKVVDQHTAVGHAVRATYMYAGMADVAAITGNTAYLSAINDIWEDVVYKKSYITGGLGSTRNGEAFGEDYDLPNMSAYAETCAAIASVYWNSRMFLLHGHGKYIDVLERTLYNGLLSGVSLSGDHFFYPNPLASIGQHQRSDWHNCACCISNMTRFLPSMPGYIYAQRNNELFVNLYVASDASILLNKHTINLTQQTNYPWEGKNSIVVGMDKSKKFTMNLRIPGWATNAPSPGDLYTFMDNEEAKIEININGKPMKYEVVNGYAKINRKWKKGDRIDIDLPMGVKKIKAHPKIKDDVNKFALSKGPIIYCLEGPDNYDSSVMNILVNKNVEIAVEYKPELLSGINVLNMKGVSLTETDEGNLIKKDNQNVLAIPYFAWANRGPSEMQVWIPYDESKVRAKPQPSIAFKSKVSSSLANKKMYRALNDQYMPKDSTDSSSYLHWWPSVDKVEWVQYDFDQAYEITSSQVYWFDDGPWGGCRVPIDVKLYYKENDNWVPVKNLSKSSIEKYKLFEMDFEKVKTTAVKMEVVLPKEFSTGIYEWQIK